MEEKQRKYRMCEECNVPEEGEFKKVVGLRHSGLIIFLHKQKQTTDETGSIKPRKSKEEVYVLHNTGGKELKRADYINEMCQYRSKCLQCRSVVEKVRSLLGEISDINKDQVLGVCEHCKRANPAGKCRRCEYIVNKFLCNKVKQYEDRQHRFNSWINKVNQLLQSILASENICRYKLYKDTSPLELEKLLQELKSPLEMRQPDITFFPNEFVPLKSMTQSKEMLEELLIKLKTDHLRKRPSEEDRFTNPSSCICKYFADKQLEGKPSLGLLPPVHHSLSELKTESELKRMDVSLERKGILSSGIVSSPSKENTETGSPKEKATKKEKVLAGKETKDNIVKEKRSDGKTLKVESKAPKQKLNSEEKMLLKLKKDMQKTKSEKREKPEKVKKLAKLDSLPELKQRKFIKVVEEKSESVLECGGDYSPPPEMIKGQQVVPFDPNYNNDPVQRQTLLFHTVFEEPIPSDPEKDEKVTKSKIPSPKGLIKYRLSDQKYIDKGWTILPTTKIMRRMDIFKMEPVNPERNWFVRHKHRKIMYYDTYEKLAEIEENGQGKWFYKNGMLALDYYHAEDVHAGQRYVVYSSGEEMENRKIKPVTVLASFDFQGNGVVYDQNGNVRLKYNQSEGMVYDERIGPPGRWKWHTLNDPPILQPIFIDTYNEYPDPSIDKLMLKNQECGPDKNTLDHDNMLNIELENFVRERDNKMLQKFKPFKIRIKVLKINDQFSLRIIDQSNIYLLFRDGQVSLKLNLGMLLISSEIVDSETTDVSDVGTPYDHIPAKSWSVAEIQHTLQRARMANKPRSYSLDKVTT